MSVYEAQFQAFQALHKIVISTVLNKDEAILVDKLVYDVTLEVPVSEKIVEKRIEKMVKCEPSLQIKDGYIKKIEVL